MKYCATILPITFLFLALSCPIVRSQDSPGSGPSRTTPPAENPPLSFEVPAEALARFNVTWVEGMADQQPALRALLDHVKPAEVAAEVLKCSPDKIQTVPHIFWREKKWLDWARKANETRQSQPKYEPKTGPDDKIPLHTHVSNDCCVVVELGPWNLGDSGAADEIAKRLAVKMVHEAPEFTRDFFRTEKLTSFDRLNNRIRDLDNQLDKLSQELRAGEGVSLSQGQLSERFADLQRQLLATSLSLDVLKARQTATVEQLDHLKTRSQAKAEDGELIRALKRLVEVRKARFESNKALNEKAKGVISQDDIDKSEEQMLTAIVELDRAKASLQKGESQSLLDSLTADLSKIAVDRAEAEARLKYLEGATKEAASALDSRRDSDRRSDRLHAQIKDKQERRDYLQLQLNQIEDALNNPGPYLQISLPD